MDINQRIDSLMESIKGLQTCDPTTDEFSDRINEIADEVWVIKEEHSKLNKDYQL